MGRGEEGGGMKTFKTDNQRSHQDVRQRLGRWFVLVLEKISDKDKDDDNINDNDNDKDKGNDNINDNDNNKDKGNDNDNNDGSDNDKDKDKEGGSGNHQNSKGQEVNKGDISSNLCRDFCKLSLEA